MEAMQDTLFPMPEATASPAAGWRERLQILAELSRSHGGLIPRSILHECLDVTRQRVAEMCREGVVEVINFYGVQFVTGRSLEHYQNGVKAKGGRGKKASRWKSFKVSVGLGQALADVLVPD